MRHAIFFVVVFALSTFAANAADICKAVAIRDVASVGSSTIDLRRGAYDFAITQYNVRKGDDFRSFCSHGGSCYPASALKLVNCRVGALSYSDAEQFSYSVDVIRARVSNGALRYDDLDNRLLQMGLCSACASNAAHAYLDRPASRCAQVVRGALEGNPVAARNLDQNFDSLCPY